MNVADVEACLHLGKKLGDLLRKPLSQLQLPVDLLMASPPCGPWAGNGNRLCFHDSRAAAFIQIFVHLPGTIQINPHPLIMFLVYKK